MGPFLLGIGAFAVSRIMTKSHCKGGETKSITLGSSFNNNATNDYMIGLKTTLVLILIVIGCKLWMIQNFSTNMQLSMHICIAYFLVQTLIPVLYFATRYDRFRQALSIVHEIFF